MSVTHFNRSTELIEGEVTIMDLTKFGYRADFKKEDKVVKQENIEIEGKTYYVSTVDMGINHRFGEGPPLWYETMVFPEGEWGDIYCDRYTTREEALTGHEKLIADIKAGKYEFDGNYLELKDSDSTASPSEAAAVKGGLDYE